MPSFTRPDLASESISFGHVPLMVDTLIQSATPDDLRAIMRNLLCSSPHTLPTFKSLARTRLLQTRAPPPLVLNDTEGQQDLARLQTVLCYARSLYGSGLGFAGLEVLTSVVHATLGRTWDEDGEFAEALAEVDMDITQAIQSCKEELIAGGVDLDAARRIVDMLSADMRRSQDDVARWQGDFPFDRAIYSLKFWRF